MPAELETSRARWEPIGEFPRRMEPAHPPETMPRSEDPRAKPRSSAEPDRPRLSEEKRQSRRLGESASAEPRYPSVCHRLPAGARLGLTFGIVLAAVVTPPEFWPVHGVLGCLIFAGQTLANIPIRYLLHRLMIFIPPVVLVALSFPMSQGFQAGWSVSAAILLRSTLALMAGIWMVHVLPFDELLSTLRRYKFPMILITTLAFAYRYVFVLWDELETMRTARRARTFGSPGLWSRWRTSAQLLAMLLLRALSRAERVHGAMCARGWDGRIRTLDEPGIERSILPVSGQKGQAGTCQPSPRFHSSSEPERPVTAGVLSCLPPAISNPPLQQPHD